MDIGALILIAEDEREIASILTSYLEREGFRTATAADGDTALAMHEVLKPDLLILDIGLPVRNGWEVLSEIRRRGWTPVVILTALDEGIDKVQGLRMGADDYVVKPFNPLEVVARARAVLRRMDAAGAQSAVLRNGPLEIDTEAYTACVVQSGRREELALTPTEFRLLVFMAKSPTRAFQRHELIDACLPEGDALERTLDSHTSNLRRKLAQQGVAGALANIRGVGYRLGRLQ